MGKTLGQRISWGALAAAFFAWSAGAQAAERVAVQSFVAKGVDPTVVSIVESSFCSALSEEKVEVLCPDALVALVASAQAKAGLGGCGLDDSECLLTLGENVKASRIVAGEVSRLGETFQITVSLIDTGTREVLVRASETVKKAERLLDAVGPLAKKLAK